MTDTITWRGEEYEVLESANFLCGFSGAFIPPLAGDCKYLMIRPVPKPLREEWRLYNSVGEPCGTFDRRDQAEVYAAKHAKGGPYTILRMREVRDE